MTRYRSYDISEIEALFERVAGLEARVAALDGGLSVPEAAAEVAATARSGGDPEITALTGQGRKLEAIKAYQDKTGASLSDAKAAVEAMGSSLH